MATDIDGIDFKTIKSECERKIMVLEARLNEVDEEKQDLAPILDKAVLTLSRLDEDSQEANTIRKRQIIGSIFPENLTFDGENYRTAKLNEAVQLIYSLDEAFRQKENGTSGVEINLSHLVNLMVQNWNRFADDLGRISV